MDTATFNFRNTVTHLTAEKHGFTDGTYMYTSHDGGLALKAQANVDPLHMTRATGSLVSTDLDGGWSHRVDFYAGDNGAVAVAFERNGCPELSTVVPAEQARQMWRALRHWGYDKPRWG
jgi:hypothetical protein